jgi:hypothetical protein
MMPALQSLLSTQTSRLASWPLQLAETPLRAALLEGVRQRNTLLDALFYDVGVVTEQEARAVAPNLAAEGAILIVPPSGQGALTLCTSVEEFVAKGAECKTLAVAGVGSSALGTAAFARNVADAVGAPVAGVVSGYGLADIATEALGGYFLFGTLNSIRHGFELLDRFTEAGTVSAPPTERGAGEIVRASRDTQTVLALLRHPELNFTLLTGHSKGNLVISEALYEMKERDRPCLDALAASSTRIVTLSATIAMPKPLKGIVDVIGQWDWFGEMNSRQDIRPEIEWPKAWHHTNTALPAHLPVKQAIKKALLTKG